MCLWAAQTQSVALSKISIAVCPRHRISEYELMLPGNSHATKQTGDGADGNLIICSL